MREPFASRILLVAILLVVGAVAVQRWTRRTAASKPGLSTSTDLNRLAKHVIAIDTRELKLAEAIWPKELLAERCGRAFEQLWDSVNAATNKLQVVASFPVASVVAPSYPVAESFPHGIQVYAPAVPRSRWSTQELRAFLDRLEQAGWDLDQLELRHLQFDCDARDQPLRSRFFCSAHLLNRRVKERACLEGDLIVDWDPTGNPQQPGRVKQVDAGGLVLKTRLGDPPLREILQVDVSPPAGSFFIDPLILYDLDGDGRSEIILAAKNLVFHRRATGDFETRPLCRFPPDLIFTGIIGDFDGDGVADFLCARFEGLYLFRGSPSGRFDDPGQLVWAASPHLKYAQTITCGDVDGDGDLDVWLGQYKLPYDRGQMPTPYYNALDGNPSYLLLNDGHGHFTDGTVQAGLAETRRRRAYSASLVDLTGRGSLDLLVASDFSGLALYANDGHGHFTDVSRTAFPEWHAFGMSQLCADFDQDARLDVLMIGMDVPTVDRLRHFGQPRPGFESYLAMGAAMTFGNRLYLGRESGRFQQTDLNQAIQRTGWSWGAAAFDADNDGYPDLYVANGHETKQSVRDYETEFWLHDIYVGNSRDDLDAFAYFQAKQGETRGKGWSYGGYEKNRFFFNEAGRSFLESGYLMGVALEEDSRNVVADDLDQDGRMDLLVTTFEAWPKVRQTLRVFQNTLPETGNWIGFQFAEEAGRPSPVGTRVSLRANGHSTVSEIVAGDAYRSQRANTLHFGLGQATRVEEATIRWLDGRVLILQNPSLNRYHRIQSPARPDRLEPPHSDPAPLSR